METEYRFCQRCEIKFVKSSDNSCPECFAASFFTMNAQGSEIGLFLYISEAGKNPLDFREVKRSNATPSN